MEGHLDLHEAAAFGATIFGKERTPLTDRPSLLTHFLGHKTGIPLKGVSDNLPPVLQEILRHVDDARHLDSPQTILLIWANLDIDDSFVITHLPVPLSWAVQSSSTWGA